MKKIYRSNPVGAEHQHSVLMLENPAFSFSLKKNILSTIVYH